MYTVDAKRCSTIRRVFQVHSHIQTVSAARLRKRNSNVVKRHAIFACADTLLNFLQDLSACCMYASQSELGIGETCVMSHFLWPSSDSYALISVFHICIFKKVLLLFRLCRVRVFTFDTDCRILLVRFSIFNFQLLTILAILISVWITPR